MPTQTLTLQSVDDTDRLGRRLANVLPPGSVVSLIGTLGAGKTRLVQAIAAGMGATEEVTSPTFVLVNEYTTGRLPIYHFDAYRLKDDDEFLELGPCEYFESDGLTLVEWGDRVENCLPIERIEIAIEVQEDESRRVVIKSAEALIRILI